ncbi:MAG: hypothetical protein HZA90_20585 [Verrucomicrobia bacterium]|nr:hypothetical protein [Verrucomicrobiota bacterium]
MKTSLLLPVALGLTVAVQSVGAATRASANYSLTTETTDAGGLRTTSAAYVHDGSLGGFGGLSGATASPEVAKHGYIGQLYEAVGLSLSAVPLAVNEGATRQVHACALLDDSTSLPLAGTSVAWSVVSGPLSSISADGIVTAMIVCEDSPAIVRGNCQNTAGTVGLMVLDVNADNYGLYASDGVNDAWQVRYFGLDNPNGLAGVDSDGDGQTNAFEYVAGTIPTNASSKFALRIENVAGHADHKAIIFSPRFPSRVYEPLFCNSLDGGRFAALTATSTNDNLLERTITDLHATNATRFYRVQISLSP